MRYFIKFSYDGNSFNGFQRQPKYKTVQGEIEKTLKELTKKKIELVASGRTDKGVHANNQTAHFDIDMKIKKENIQKYLNTKLEKEIYIKEIKEVNEDFHARYDVKEKTYKYYINIGIFNPIQRNQIYQYNKKIDLNKLKTASKKFIGTHDFRSFMKQDKTKENCIRTITKITIKKEKNIIIISLTGNGFLRKMVRNIVGLLIEVANDTKDIETIKLLLNNPEQKINIKSVPGCGLYLDEVKY